MNDTKQARAVFGFIGGSLLLYLLFPSFFLRHHDLGWHLRGGELIWNSGDIPQNDPWSFTANGYRWFNISWLWDVLAWLLFKAAGLTGLVLATIYSASAIVAFQALASFSFGARPAVLAIVLLWANCWVLTYEQPDNPLAVSPQALTLLLMAWTNSILLSPRLTMERKLLLCAGSMLFWTNSHGGFPAGLFAILLWFVGTILLTKQRPSMRAASLFLLTVLSPFLTPLGFSMVEAMDRSLGHISIDFISEWDPYSFHTAPLLSSYIVAFVLTSALSGSAFVMPLLSTQSFAWLAAGLLHQRYLALFFVVSVPVLAVSLSSLLRLKPSKIRHQEPRFARITLPNLPIFLMLLAAPALYFCRTGTALTWPEEMDPKTEIDYLRKHHRGERIFNEWNFGSFLIFHAAGELPIFIDGRAGTAYPPELFELYTQEYLAPDADWNNFLDRFGLKLALVARYRMRAVEFFAKNPCWKKEFEGPAAIVYAKVPGTCLSAKGTL